MPKMLSDGDDKLLWIPDGGINDINDVKLSEFTAEGVLDASCLASKADFNLGSTGDETISDPALCAGDDSGAPGKTNYEAAMNFYRYTTTAEDKAWNTFTGKGIAGFLAHRIGKPSAVAPSAEDEWAIYGVITGTPTKVIPDANGGFRKFRQTFFVQGELVNERVKLTA